jgi:hypothetical protein
MEKTMKERLKTIQYIADVHNLTPDVIADIVYENGGTVSTGTIKKMIKEGENAGYHYQPVADVHNALIAKFGEDYNINDLETLQRIIKERDRQIDSLMMQNEELQEANGSDFERRLRVFDERKTAYEHTIAILEQQIDRLFARLDEREKVIAHKDEIIEKMLERLNKE